MHYNPDDFREPGMAAPLDPHAGRSRVFEDPMPPERASEEINADGQRVAALLGCALSGWVMGLVVGWLVGQAS